MLQSLPKKHSQFSIQGVCWSCQGLSDVHKIIAMSIFYWEPTQGDKWLNSLRWGISAGKPKGWWIRSGYWCGVPKREVAKATRGGHGAGWFWNDGGYEWHRKFRWWGACCSASALWSTRCYIISALTFWSQAQYLFCQQRGWFWIS